MFLTQNIDFFLSAAALKHTLHNIFEHSCGHISTDNKSTTTNKYEIINEDKDKKMVKNNGK